MALAELQAEFRETQTGTPAERNSRGQNPKQRPSQRKTPRPRKKTEQSQTRERTRSHRTRRGRTQVILSQEGGTPRGSYSPNPRRRTTDEHPRPRPKPRRKRETTKRKRSWRRHTRAHNLKRETPQGTYSPKFRHCSREVADYQDHEKQPEGGRNERKTRRPTQHTHDQHPENTQPRKPRTERRSRKGREKPREKTELAKHDMALLERKQTKRGERREGLTSPFLSTEVRTNTGTANARMRTGNPKERKE